MRELLIPPQPGHVDDLGPCFCEHRDLLWRHPVLVCDLLMAQAAVCQVLHDGLMPILALGPPQLELGVVVEPVVLPDFEPVADRHLHTSPNAGILLPLGRYPHGTVSEMATAISGAGLRPVTGPYVKFSVKPERLVPRPGVVCPGRSMVRESRTN